MMSELVSGLQEFAEKNGFTRAVIGLSGGIDSAVTACIAVRAFGKENVLGVLMPSNNTREESMKLADELAQNLGIQAIPVSIHYIYMEYLKTVSDKFELTGVTMQNIQARIRANILMAISNSMGHLVLNTSNKSELTVGYGTLYGDLAGGIAVLGNVYKTQVYALAREINRAKGIIPQGIIDREPSAELTPTQKDTDDLPPYDLLDSILKAIEEGKPLDGFDKVIVADVKNRINKNRFKAKQCPEALRVKKAA